MDTQKEKSFIKLIVTAEQRILGYLIALLPSVQDAEDLLQETSIVMWDKYDEFLATQDGEPDIGRFVAWGNKIAFYKVLNSRRQKRWKLRLLSDEVIKLVSDEWIRQDEADELKGRHQALKQCIDKLPEGYRNLLREYYWSRTSVGQIAEQSERTVGSVYKVLQRARKSLHKCIEKRLPHL